MAFFLLVLCLEIIFHSSFYSNGTFNINYLSKENTRPIKGIFVILIILSHFVQYITPDSILDAPYISLKSHLDQMVVAPFLFYSGFGIMKSIQIKGDSYVKQIMKKRFPQVLFDFMRAVILFLILNLVLGKTYFLKQILLSFIGWESIGNSNWYILGILLLYIATFVSFTLVRACKGIKKDVLGCILLSLLISGIVCLLKISGKPSYYYNT